MTSDLQELSCHQAEATRLESSLCLLTAFALLGTPRDLIDIGCGKGHLVRVARALGVTARGVDLYLAPAQNLERFDLTQPWPDSRSFEMALSLEVAEHLPASAAETFADTLAAVTGKWLLFSAATPGQGGSGHLNERPHDYWSTLLVKRGLALAWHPTQVLRGQWKQLAPAAWWYGKNCLVFRRDGA